MATEPEEGHFQPEEEEGGPTKTFLEHLEDLRWTLMKCVASVAVGFLLCLFASPAIVSVLTWPLEKAKIHAAGKQPTLTIQLGDKKLGTINLQTNQLGLLGTNIHTTVDLVPVESGSNIIFALKPVGGEAVAAKGRGINLVNLGPATAFFLAVEMAIYGGIALALPFLLYFIGQFVFPALKIKERKYTYWGLGVGSLLFLMGVTFCYFVLMPLALNAAVQYSEWMGFTVTDWRAEEYIRFVSKFIIGMGLGFEMPIVILVLVKIGILDYQKLAGFRRYMIVVNLILGAVLTTPEVITQVLMAIPLQILYEISVWIAWYWERQERKRREAEER